MRKWIGIIIDDQQADIDHLLAMLSDIDYVEIVAIFTEHRAARNYLIVNRVDFMILDVELGNTTGFRFLRSLPDSRIPTILYTAFEQYEDQGYDLDLVDVMLKPVSESRFIGALRRVHKELAALLPDIEQGLEGHSQYFQVRGPVRNARQIVWLKNIVYVATENGKVVIHLVGGCMLESAASFRVVMDMLPSRWFKQCYQNIVFNINFYASYSAGQVVLTERNIALPVGSKDLYMDFFKFLDSNNV